MRKLKKGNYFRTNGGLIGEIKDIKVFNETSFIETIKMGKIFHFALNDIKKCSEDILDLLEYEDLLKVFDKVANGFIYYGFSENNFNELKDLKEALKTDDTRIIVGIVPKEKIKENMFYFIDTVCGEKEKESCQKEKMGCEGCFYNLK